MRDPALPETAAVLFVNARGEVLLHLRDDKPGIVYPGRWGLIGGHVEPGESVEEALMREVKEEIGEVLGEHEYAGTFESARRVHVFVAGLDKPAESLPLSEGQCLRFVTPRAALSLPLVPWLADMLPGFVRSELYERVRKPPPHLQARNPEAASVIFVNGRGELLLRLRDDKPDIPFPGCWDLIGGAVEQGESHAEAAMRETREEVGIYPEGAVYWGSVPGYIITIHVYAAPLDVPAESLTLSEGERLAWLSPEEALLLPLVPYMERLLPAFAASPLYAALRDA